MKRLLAASAVLMLTLSACGGGIAATVDGVDITVEEVAALRTESISVAETDFSDDLYNIISDRVASKAADEDFGVGVTDEELAAELETIREELAAQGTDLDARLEELGLSDKFVDLLASQEVLSRKVIEALSAELPEIGDEEIQEVYDAELANYETQLVAQEEQAAAQAKYAGVTVCTKHILVPTEPEAQDVLSRLDAGEAFADLAVELSTDTGSGAAGGELGCGSPAQYVTEFADVTMDAEVGVPTGPVETQFGFHIILVDSREVDEEAVAETPAEPEPFPSLEEVRADILASLELERESTLFSEWFVAKLRAAEVTVAEAYGTWTTPDDPAGPPTLTPPSA